MKARLWQLVVIVLLVLPIGCGQQTAVPVDQGSEQQTITPSTTAQEQAAQGSQVYVWVVNGPGKGDLPNPGALDLKSDADAAIIGNASGANGGEASAVDGRFAQAGFSININTGAGPGQTGTTTGTTSGTSQTPSAAATAYPSQEIKPSISIPVGVAMPGGSNTQQANAVGEGSSSGTSQVTTNDLKTQLNSLQGKVDEMGDLLKSLQKSWETLLTPGSQPAQAGHEE